MKQKLILVLFLFTVSFTVKSQQVLKVGQTLTGLALKDTNGLLYDLNNQKKAKGFILVFMTPTCDHCLMYESRVMALDKKYKPQGFSVVAIGPYGDDPVKYPLDAMPEMKKLAAKNHFTFPYVSDEGFKYTWLFGIKSTPTAVVLTKQAKGYLINYIGKIDDNEHIADVKTKYVENELKKLL